MIALLLILAAIAIAVGASRKPYRPALPAPDHNVIDITPSPRSCGASSLIHSDVIDILLPRPGELAFTREPLARGERFALTATGSYRFGRHKEWAYESDLRGDAETCWGRHGPDGGRDPRRILLFDGNHLEPIITREAESHYVYAYVGKDTPLVVALDQQRDETLYFNGNLTVMVTPLASGETAPYARQLQFEEGGWSHSRQEKEREREERKQREAKRSLEQQCEQERERQETEEKKRRELQTRVEITIEQLAELTSYDDEAFLEAFARKHADEIVAHRDDIMEKDRALLANRQFVLLLREKSPVTLARLRWPVRALNFAERAAVAKPRSSRRGRDDEDAPPRRRTEVEVRELITRRDAIKKKDEIAKILQRVRLAKDVRTDLDELELTEDERQEIEQQIKEILEQEEDGNARRTIR